MSTQKDKRNTSQMVYRILKTNILDMNLQPGTLISEKEISEKLQVSRTPVREAFISLSKESLVTIRPQRGTYISKISFEKALEERFLRESVECAVLEEFIHSYTNVSFAMLMDNLKLQEQAFNRGDYEKLDEYDNEFHKIFYTEAGKQLCYEIIQNNCNHYKRIRSLSILLPEICENNLRQHQQLIECIKKNNVSSATDILKNHLQKLLTEKDELISKYPEYFDTPDDTLPDINFKF